MSRIPPPRIPLAPRIPLPPVCRGLPSREMRTPVVIAPPHRAHRGIPRATATGAFISTETQRTPTRTGVSVVPPYFVPHSVAFRRAKCAHPSSIAPPTHASASGATPRSRVQISPLNATPHLMKPHLTNLAAKALNPWINGMLARNGFSHLGCRKAFTCTGLTFSPRFSWLSCHCRNKWRPDSRRPSSRTPAARSAALRCPGGLCGGQW